MRWNPLRKRARGTFLGIRPTELAREGPVFAEGKAGVSYILPFKFTRVRFGFVFLCLSVYKAGHETAIANFQLCAMRKMATRKQAE